MANKKQFDEVVRAPVFNIERRTLDEIKRKVVGSQSDFMRTAVLEALKKL